MNHDGYEVAHVDELDALPVNGGEFIWRPVRRRFGISAFGTNAYTAEKAGQRVIEEHSERDGHEEMYVVLRGGVTFTLGDDELAAGPGTLVFVRPGTRRGAIATEDGTFVLAVGAKPGVVFEPSPWEQVFAGYTYAELGIISFEWNFIVEFKRADFDRFHLLRRKIKDHRLLHPVVHLPYAGSRFRHAQFSSVQQRYHFADRVQGGFIL